MLKIKPFSAAHLRTCFVTKESLFFRKEVKVTIFLRKKYIMSLFRTIFAFGNGREAGTLGFVFPGCLRYAFALASLPEAKKDTRHRHGTN